MTRTAGNRLVELAIVLAILATFWELAMPSQMSILAGL